MSRHIIDNRTPSDGGRLRHFYRIEKAGSDGTIPEVIRKLHQRQHRIASTGRIGQFLRIARGITA